MTSSQLTSGRQRWRRWRGVIAVVSLLVVTAVVIGVVQSGASRGLLDPAGVDAAGSRALVTLLAQQGVQVEPVRTTADAVAAAGPADTLLVTSPDLLTDNQVDEVIDTGARLVLVAPDTSLATFVPGVTTTAASTRSVPPNCDLPVAIQAGTARLGGHGYAGQPESTSWTACYPVDGRPTVVATVNAGGFPIVLLGSPAPLTNEFLDQDGNAALAIGLLGGSERLVWYRPIPEAGDTGGVPLTSQLPSWARAMAAQLAIAVVLAALWRARRIGRVVADPLPVVVRASETTEGRAELYRRGRAREHAAELLRRASARRLQHGGRTAAEADALVTGPPPTDDPGLVSLADHLDALETEARTP